MKHDDPPLVPQSAAEFGRGLQRLRRFSLRELEERQHTGSPDALWISKSQLNRYEQGTQLPRLQYAEHLDRLYEAGGWIELSLRSLWRPDWNPWNSDHGSSGCYQSGSWPARYRGTVWIKILPLPINIGKHHHVQLNWGPWQCRLELDIDELGTVLLTGKSVDESGQAVTCNVSTDIPIFTLFGAGEHLEQESVIDIRGCWEWKA